jgi:thioredoxin 1
MKRIGAIFLLLTVLVGVAASDSKELTAAFKAKLPVVAKLGADWCYPCKAMKPILKELATEQKGKIVVLDLNINENRDLAAKNKINLIPTTLFYDKTGKLKAKKTGYISKTELLETLKKLGMMK